ncbi:efflux RND transporter periplasmic adaptor subunit [Pontibacter ramchanderi]|nr:efflux RND transporter periplasmic adaptor subunit [Pontibacter ramchanderi]
MELLTKKSYILITLTISALVAGCTAQGGEIDNSKTETALPVTELITKDTTLHLDYVSDIQAVRHIEVRARINGFIDKIYVDEGQEVKEGQVLFKLNSKEREAELAKAKANLNNAVAEAMAAEVEVGRVRLLVEKNVISASELALAKAKHKAANARVEEARSTHDHAKNLLAYTSIRAPFSGIVDRIPLKVGSIVSEGDLLTSLSDLQSVYAYFEVSEKEYLSYIRAREKGDDANDNAVQLILADGSTYPHEGKIETMEGVFAPNTGSIAFRATFPNPSKILKHHATGKVRLFNEVDSALLVPQKAAFEIQDKNFVYVVGKDNKVQTRSFEPKARFTHFYIVESGLEPGEQVVYEGAQTLREGTMIKPELIPMDSLLAATPR